MTWRGEMASCVIRIAQSMLDRELMCQLADLVVFAAVDEGDADPGAARAACPPDSVDIAFVVAGRIEVDHVRDSGDVDPAGGDVGRHHFVTAPDWNLASACSRWR
jgi:hypothetical protein